MKLVRTPLVFVMVAVGSAHARAQQPNWIAQVGSPGLEVALGAASDGVGGVYFAGTTDLSFGGPSFGGMDVWLVRMDGAGQQLWTRKLGSSSPDVVSGVASGNGCVFVGGSTSGVVGSSGSGGSDAWIARYDQAGNSSWIAQFGGSANDKMVALVADSGGVVFSCGVTDGSFGGPHGGGSDSWIVRHDASGNPVWIRQLGTPYHDDAAAILADGSGGVIVAGSTGGALAGTSAGADDAWFGRFDGSGQPIWMRQLGTSATDWALTLAPGPNGDFFVGGMTQGALGSTPTGNDDGWIARYDAMGNQLWIRQLRMSGYDVLGVAAADGTGGVYVAGMIETPFFAHAYPENGWIGHYDGTGKKLWTAEIGGATEDWISGVALDPAGGFFVCGTTNGSLGGPSAGAYDVWFARYDAACRPATVYCTAKTNSDGCTPSIAMTGFPSASAGAGCLAEAWYVIGGGFGMFVHSTSGASASPFQGGQLCLKPPLRRHATTLSSGGVSSCNGIAREDFNAYIASGHDPALVAGAQVWLQHWSPDPGDPTGVGLTDAMTVTIGP